MTSIAVEQLARLGRRQHRRLAAFDHVLRAAHGVGGVDGEDLADDQPVEQHADGGQVLLDGRLLKVLAERLDLGGDVHRLDVGDRGRPVAPVEEFAWRRGHRLARVGVADVGGEEFDEAPAGVSPARRSRGAAPRRHDGRRRWSAAGSWLAQEPVIRLSIFMALSVT